MKGTFNRTYECLQDLANTIRLELSYSRDKEEYFERLLKRGILLNINTEKKEITFKTLCNTFTNKLIVNELKDDFFEFESLRNNIGYNLEPNKEKIKYLKEIPYDTYSV